MDGRRDRPAVAAAYAEARARLQDEARALDLADARLAWARLALAALAIAIAAGALATARWSAGWAALPVMAFAAVAMAHGRSLAARTAARRRLAWVEQGLARIEHRWQGQGNAGDSHRPGGHPYAEDLDLFGRASLFELLCTARTDVGERTLARWLLAPARPAVVADRQAAVAELSSRPALREDLNVLGPDLPRAATTAALAAWAGAPTAAPAWWSRTALVALSTATLSGVAWWWSTGEPAPWLGGALAAQAVVGWRLRPGILSAIRHVEETAHDLSLAASLIERLEREAFEGPSLQALRQRLEGGGLPASAAIRRLAHLAELLASRRNQCFGPLALLLFWATHLAWAIDRWRARHGTHVAAWFDVIGEVEARSAL
ncbi:MAG: DNA mismatch repair protein MutS, partial [Vicinamibacterales bacterium]